MNIAFGFEYLLEGYGRKDVVQVPSGLARILSAKWFYITRPSKYTAEIVPPGTVRFLGGRHNRRNRERLEGGQHSRVTFTRTFSIRAGWHAAAFADVYVTMFIGGRTALGVAAYRLRRILKGASAFVYVKADLGLSGRENLDVGACRNCMSRLRRRLLDRWLFETTNVVSVESIDGRRWVDRNFPLLSRRAIVVRNCPISFEAQPVESFNEQRRHQFIAVARLGDPDKGIDVLLPAFRRFCQKNQGWELLLVGQSTQTFLELLRDYSDLIESGRIRLTGFVRDHVKLSLLYRSSMFFVQPSRREGNSLALIEAIHDGCVPLCTRVMPVDEVLGKYAGQLAFEPSSVEALSCAMEWVAMQGDRMWSEMRVYLKELTKDWSWSEQLAPIAERMLLRRPCEIESAQRKVESKAHSDVDVSDR